MKEKKTIKEIARKVEAKFQMGGLSDGLYFDFAKEVALYYSREQYQAGAESERKRILKALKSREISPGVTNGKSQFTAEDVYNIINQKN